MDELRTFFFESPVKLAVTLGVIEVLLLGAWRQRQTLLTQRLAMGGLATSIVLLMVCQWIVTDVERVQEVCEAMGRAVDDGDVDGFGMLLTDTFESDEWDKSALLAEIYRVLEKYTIDDVRIDRFRVSVTGDQAVASFRARAWVRNAPGVNPDFHSRWEAKLVEAEDKRWLMTGLKMIKYGPVDVNGLRGIMTGW